MIQFDLFTTLSTALKPTVTDHKTEPIHKGNFYNTTELSGKELIDKRRKVAGQTAKILKVFEDHPHTRFSPYDLYYHFGEQIDRNSIRRAITDLTTDGYLDKGTKEERRRSGPFNELNYTWKLK